MGEILNNPQELINTEYKDEVKLAPIIKRKCDGCDAIIHFRKDQPIIKECVDCRDGITPKK